MRGKAILALAVLSAGCSPHQNDTSYTGRFRVDAGAEYVALDVPSSIGGACEGWRTVEIRKPGMPGTDMTNIVCWKRSGDMITLSDHIGLQQKSGPASLWSD